MKPADWLILQKKVRFGDCDSAGVIHFHNLLKWSHEAWEESIEIYGIPYIDIFPDFSIRKSQIIFPIINCEANFLAPIKIGDFLKVPDNLWGNKIKIIIEFRELTNHKSILNSLNLLKKFSQSWPKHEKPEKWIVKQTTSSEKINYKFKK